jgi:WD40 repeat protein/tRNA A-37 threonylcarbamoyl transferase component Bud32
MVAMARETRLQELLRQWQQSREKGKPLAPEELCRDCPELLPELRRHLRPNEAAEPATSSFHSSGPQSASPAGPRDYPPVPGYEIVGELGRGGMGVVYKARQLKLNRLVALKMILAGGHVGDDQMARFRREAEAVAQLQHPGIVQIYEVGEQDGLPFFSLELIEGGSLADKLAGMPLPPGEAAALLEPLARAVQAAHERGIIHRDLKPANVLLTAAGAPKVTDFGLAKRVEVGGNLTATGAVLGTPSYMAPEQASGDGRRVGPAADVYALGALLYECLTGRPPFQGPTPVDTLLQVVSEEPVPPSRLQPKVPRDLETICLKCLHKDPARRYESAAAVADDLARFQAGQPIRARPSTTPERVLKWMKRRPALAALVAVSGVACLASVGVLVGLWYNAQLQASNAGLRRALDSAEGAKYDEAVARQAAERAREGEVQARKGEEDLRKQLAAALAREENTLYVRRISLAEREYQANNIAQVDRILEECPRQLRHWEWRYLKRLCHPELLTFRGHRGRAPDRPDEGPLVGSVAYGPEGTRIASACFTADWVKTGEKHEEEDVVTGISIVETVIWDATTGKGLHTCKQNGGNGRRGYTTVVFSPDGKLLASAGGGWEEARKARVGEVKVWDAKTGKETLTFSGHNADVTSVAFSPDGKWLASASSREERRETITTIKLWDPHTGKEWKTFRATSLSDCPLVCFSPDGTHLAVSAMGVKLWDIATDKETLSLPGGFCLAFSPDSTRIATVAGDGLGVFDARTGKKVWTSRFAATCAAFSPDGKQLAAALLEGDLFHKLKPGRVLILDAANGNFIREFRGHTEWVTSVAYRPDGRRLASASADGTVKVWDVASPPAGANQKEEKEARGPEAPLTASIDKGSNDTEWVVVVKAAATGEEALTLRLKSNHQFKAVISPDGQFLSTNVHLGAPAVQVWEIKTGRQLFTLPHEQSVNDMAFSPDGKRLAVGCGNFNEIFGSVGQVYLWETTSGQELLRFEGQNGFVTKVMWSPDGYRLTGQTVRDTQTVWDARPFPPAPATEKGPKP